MKKLRTLLSSPLSIINNPIARNSAIMFTGTMAANFGAYLYHLLVGRIMGPERYGEFAALFSLLFIISVPANVIQTVLIKYFSTYKATNNLPQAKALFLITTKYIAIAGLVCGVIYVLLIPVMQSFLHVREWQSLLWVYMIFVSFFFITGLSGILIGYQKFIASSIITTISVIFRLASGVLLASFGVAMTLLGNAVANLVSLIIFFFSIAFLLPAKKEALHLPKREALTYSVPTLIASLGITLIYNLDVILVKHFFSAGQAGIYGSLNLFGKIIYFASSAVGFVVFPMIAERKELKKPYNDIVLLGLIIVGGISLSIALMYGIFSTLVSTLLFGQQFAKAAPYLGFFGLFMSGVTIGNYLTLCCLAINKTAIANIWIGVIALQAVGILLFHAVLAQVIIVNIVVASLLVTMSLLYYRYGRSH